MKHKHEWKRVAPVVVVIGDPLGLARVGESTHNAVCLCGAKAWLHWPEPKRAA